MAKLVTGGTGYIGSEVARQLLDSGDEVVIFDITMNRYRIEDIEKKVKVVIGDVGNLNEVLNVIKDNNITEVYHLGSILTWMSELNPWASFRTNTVGTYNVLEAARLLGVPKMMFASSLSTFGFGMKGAVSDTTLQRPVAMYGCSKLYGEGLGRWYRSKFGLDFRSVRYAQMVGPNVRTPGHWAPSMIEDAILGKPNDCVWGTPESSISMIYVNDAAKAAIDVMVAPKDKIKMINYNVAGIPEVISAAQLEALLKQRYPKTKVNYKADASTQKFYRNAMTLFDDSYARKEWGWKPAYSTPQAIIEQFEQDVTEHPKRYGLT